MPGALQVMAESSRTCGKTVRSVGAHVEAVHHDPAPNLEDGRRPARGTGDW